jgi:hypothetical protein
MIEGFDDITTIVPDGGYMENNSQPMGITEWFQGNSDVFTSESGADDSYIGANFNNGSGTATISNWLLTPPLNLENGAQLTFWARTVDSPRFPDRLQVRMSTNGGSENVGTTATQVGDFTTLLLDINPTYTLTGFPSVWTQYTVTIGGLGGPVIGRIGFRYFVENGGPSGAHSDYIGVDSVGYAGAGATPSPSPTETATATATSAPTETPQPTPTVTPEPTPTVTPEPTPTETPEPTPTETPQATPTETPEPTDTPQPTATSSPENTPTSTPETTPTPSETPTPTPSGTPFPTPTPTFEGNFVIGDVNAVVGNHVTFWGAQWAQHNSLSGGTAPHSFKGFANSTNPNPVGCGGTWTSSTGNSGGPPSGLPTFITAIAASSITQTGSTINGNVSMLVVIQTDPGYQPNPGHAGTGTVVNVTCVSAPLSNISTRLRVETSDNTLIGGFIITGTHQKKVMVRAIGPSLSLSDRLADPILGLYDSAGQLIAANDNWIDAPNRQEIINSGIPPSNNLESAILISLPPGAYTATMRGINNTTGIGLVETYDLDRGVNSRLANISTRGLVQTNDNVLIAGMILLGHTSQTILVRAIGPSLGLSGVLADPVLELRDGNGALIKSNDNWRSDQEAEIIATTIAPTNDLESAIVATLPTNGASYTAVVRGANGSTGIAVVEVYGLN